jgi:hypothetical protein
MQDQLLLVLNEFQPISLGMMDRVKLMNRTDRKYQCRLSQLKSILIKAKQNFSILEVNGSRLQAYESLYLDTPGQKMYFDHHNGKLNRYKIRIREYMASREFYLEIKRKDNKKKTHKKRIPISSDRNFLLPEFKAFISRNTPFDPEALEPKLLSSFDRITLVNTDIGERITIDINPSWKIGQQAISLSDLVIIEVKSAKTTSSAGFGYLLREERIFPHRISKYCIGTALLYPEIKHNRFKEKLLYLGNIDKGLKYDELYPVHI